MADYDNNVNVYASYFVDKLEEFEEYEALEILLERVVNHPRLQRPFFGFYSHRIQTGIRLEAGDSLLKFAYKKNKFNLVNGFWKQGREVIARDGYEGEMALLRWSQANLLIRLTPGLEAFRVLERIAQDPEIATPVNPWHWLKDKAEMELARLYLTKALDARDQDRWNEVGEHAHKLFLLAHREGDGEASSAALILAAWNRLSGRPIRAKQCARAHVEQALDMLYDADEENDTWAWSKICNAVLAVGDEGRSKAAVGMYGSLRFFGNVMGLVDFKEKLVDEGNEKQDEQIETEETSAVAVDKSKVQSNEEVHKPNGDTAGGIHEANGIQQAPITLLPVEGTDSTLSASQPNTGGALNDTVDTPERMDDHHEDSSTPPVAGVDTACIPTSEGPSRDEAEHGNCESKQEGGTDTENENALYSCDGPCFADIPGHKKVFRCSYCISDLCESCHTLIKDGKNIDFAVCGRTHEAFEMQPLEKYPAKMMRVGSDFVPVQAWLDDLADEWGVKRRGAKELSGENQP
jgi:hypothetical protein